jgi:hypothetical protein
MMKIHVLVGAMAVLSGWGTLSAEEAAGHLLAKAGSLPEAGKVFSRRENSEFGEAALKLKFEFQTAKGTFSRKVASNELYEGLGDGKARRVLMSRTVETRRVIEEMEEPEPEQHDELQGLPVIVEFKEGKWHAGLEEGEATPEQKTALDELLEQLRAEPDLAIYGKEARKPGETWKVDLKELKEFCGMSALEGEFSVQFLELKEVAGTSCAVLKSVFDLKGVAPAKKGEAPLKMAAKGEVLSHRSLKDLVDLESKLSGTLLMEGSPGGGLTFSIEGPLKSEMTVKVGKN